MGYLVRQRYFHLRYRLFAMNQDRVRVKIHDAEGAIVEDSVELHSVRAVNGVAHRIGPDEGPDRRFTL